MNTKYEGATATVEIERADIVRNGKIKIGIQKQTKTIPDCYYIMDGEHQIRIYHRENNNPEVDYKDPDIHEHLLTIEDNMTLVYMPEGTTIIVWRTHNDAMKELQRFYINEFLINGKTGLIAQLREFGAKQKIEETKIKYE